MHNGVIIYFSLSTDPKAFVYAREVRHIISRQEQLNIQDASLLFTKLNLMDFMDINQPACHTPKLRYIFTFLLPAVLCWNLCKSNTHKCVTFLG